MKKIIVVFAAIVMIAGFSSRVFAQKTENTSAAALLIAPITLAENASLDFGTLAVLAGTAGTCVISTASPSVRTPGGGVNVVSTSTFSAAAYTVTGDNSRVYTIAVPSTISVTHTNTTTTMTVNTINYKAASAATENTNGTLGATNGTDTFKVGGTLQVLAGQLAGAYQGTFDVTVAYQ